VKRRQRITHAGPPKCRSPSLASLLAEDGYAIREPASAITSGSIWQCQHSTQFRTCCGAFAEEFSHFAAARDRSILNAFIG